MLPCPGIVLVRGWDGQRGRRRVHVAMPWHRAGEGMGGAFADRTANGLTALGLVAGRGGMDPTLH